MFYLSENATYNVGAHYASGNGTVGGLYWLNNFDSLWSSYG